MTSDARALGALVLLALWLGAALLLAASVAPAAFAVLPTRTAAGALVGRILPVVFWGGVIAGFTAALLLRHASAPRSGVVAAIGTAVACAAAQLLIAPWIARIRSGIGGSVDSLPVDDARRVLFGRLHGASVALLAVAVLCAVLALLLTIRAGAADRAAAL